MDMEKLKAEMKVLAVNLKERPATDPMDWPDRRVVRFTRLCALKASLRGRLHFAPGTNLAEARWIFHVPCLVSKDATDQNFYDYEYKSITLEIQEKWVEETMLEFVLEESKVVV